MPPRRSRSGARRRPVNQEKENSVKLSKQEYDKQLQEIMKIYDDVEPDNIFKCKHPIENTNGNNVNDEKGHTKAIKLTPIQKAITFCIQHNGGSATDDEVLAFIHRFWPTIVTFSLSADSGINYQYSKPIDKRVLHINFQISKDNQPLFIKIEENRWKLNTPASVSSSNQTTTKTEKNNNSNTTTTNNNNNNSTPPSQVLENLRPRNPITARVSATRNSTFNSNSSSSNSNSIYTNLRTSARLNNNSNSRDASTFQDKVVEVIKNARSQSLTTDEIINKSAGFKDEDGIYPNLPLDTRVKCVLEIKKILKEVTFDEKTSKWSCSNKQFERQKNYYLPKDLKGIRMKELTVYDLWNLLKEKDIY